MDFVHCSWHWLDASIAFLRKTVFQLEYIGNFKKKNETLVETQCLRLTNVTPNAQSRFIKLFELLNQRTDTYLFVFLKKISNTEKTEKGPLSISTQKLKN
jgi:hypothetical protein